MTDEHSAMYVNGTLMWYYYICHRQVWLIARHLTPDEDDPNIQLGKYISEHAYPRERKEISLGPVKLDIMTTSSYGGVIVAEVKKSSRYLQSAKMQLLLYLDELEKRGVRAIGELRIPEERRREVVRLDEDAQRELDKAKRDILRIVYLPDPPKAEKTRWCRSCAYYEFCWA